MTERDPTYWGIKLFTPKGREVWSMDLMTLEELVEHDRLVDHMEANPHLYEQGEPD